MCLLVQFGFGLYIKIVIAPVTMPIFFLFVFSPSLLLMMLMLMLFLSYNFNKRQRLILCCCYFSGSSLALTQNELDVMARDLSIEVKVLDNLRHDAVDHIVRITLTNKGNTDIPASGWTLYFHSMLLVYPAVFPKNMTVDLEIEQIQVGMVQGDLYFMRPLGGFVAMATGSRRDFDITVTLWAVSRTDFMPYWYLVSDDPNVQPSTLNATNLSLDYVKPFDDPRQWKRVTWDEYNPYTTQERFERFGFKDTGKVCFSNKMCRIFNKKNSCFSFFFTQSFKCPSFR